MPAGSKTYSLLRPIVAFRAESGEKLTLPQGARLTLSAAEPQTGISAVVWRGNRIMVFTAAVEANGLQVQGKRRPSSTS